MVWAIVGVAVLVMGIAAVASTGALGEMPPPGTDRRRRRTHDGDPAGEEALSGEVAAVMSAENLATIRFEMAEVGYSREQVDRTVAGMVTGAIDPEQISSGSAPGGLFEQEPGGYQMEQVDVVFAQLGAMRNNGDAVGQEEMREPNGSDEATHR